MTSLIIPIFIVLMFTGLPVFFSLLLASCIGIFISDGQQFLPLFVNKFIGSLQSFTLLALPFFILAGNIMGRGGITARIIDFSKSMVGHKKGGLGHVVVLSSTIYSALTGSAVAATSAIGSMLIPKMTEEGYSKSYSAAITSAATVLGPIIPPSGIMIIYAFTMNTSIAAMFIAAIIPGLLFCFSLMLMNYLQCVKKGYLFTAPKATARERGHSFKKAFWALLSPVIILGGIYGGIFTPTEAAAVAAVYAAFSAIVIYRSLSLRGLLEAIRESVISSAAILLLIAVASGFGSMVSLTPISQQITSLLYGITRNPYVLFAIVNIMLLIIGMFLDAGPAILIFAAILAKPLTDLGVDPVHFGVVMSINVTIGLATPPMGLVLFVAANLSGISFEKIALEALPFIAVEVAIVFLLSFFPDIVLVLPRLLGFV